MHPPQSGFPSSAFEPANLPDDDREFLQPSDIEAFAKALDAPESSPIVALNDWRPIRQRVKKKNVAGKARRKKLVRRTKDETREGFVYELLKWPLLLIILGWILGLSLAYVLTRFYIWAYERLVTWRGRRQALRKDLRSKTNYEDWTEAAKQLDDYLGNDQWKKENEYAYYDHLTVKKVTNQLRDWRTRAESAAEGCQDDEEAVHQLRGLVEACVKNNFVGVENPRLYSEAYYGTKDLVQDFEDELSASIAFLLRTPRLSSSEKYTLSRHMHTNFGRTALCLSGGASFAWYHFGVVKALLDASLLPDVVTGTSGGAIVAALVATRTDDELKKLLVPALAFHITACEDPFWTWIRRWWKTGARFDSLAWAKKCSWFCRGNTTFKEAYDRTGRILNVSCVPSDPYSPTILTNYLTAPDCVIWSAVLASAAVPGILNPVVMMAKNKDGSLSPYSFGHKWKDGSLRTDVPLKALNLHFGVTFSVVSQVNPHINAFFYASKGTVGRPVTHRRGRGWRGGYLGSATETYLKLELQKFLKMLRHLELLPRPLGQDWSGIWLQQFSGTITIWPKSRLSDFYYILSDPTPSRLARMLLAGQQSTFPKLLFVRNRMAIERLLDEGLLFGEAGQIDLKDSLVQASLTKRDRRRDGSMHVHAEALRTAAAAITSATNAAATSPSVVNSQTASHATNSTSKQDLDKEHEAEEKDADAAEASRLRKELRRSSVLQEIKRQSGVFFDDDDVDKDTEGSEYEGNHEDGGDEEGERARRGTPPTDSEDISQW